MYRFPPAPTTAVQWRHRFRFLLPLQLWACTSGEMERTAPEGRYSGMGLLDESGTHMIWAGGGTEDGFVETCWRFNLDSETWESRPPLPLPLLRSAAVRHEGQLHMVAGTTSGREEVDTLLQMDLETGVWTVLDYPGGPSPRYKHMAVAMDREMVVIGGKFDDEDPVQVHGDVWRLDIDSGVWTEQSTTGGPLGIYRHAMAADPQQDRIWVQGGFDAEENRSDWLWSLDTVTWEWTRHSWTEPGPPVRASHALVLIDDGLLLWGGNHSDTSTWLFDETTSTWDEWARSPAPSARDAFVYDLHPNNRQVILVGGDPVRDDVPNFVSDFWVLDLDTQTWQEIVPIQEE